jgi:hypothetical protein
VKGTFLLSFAAKLMATLFYEASLFRQVKCMIVGCGMQFGSVYKGENLADLIYILTTATIARSSSGAA